MTRLQGDVTRLQGDVRAMRAPTRTHETTTAPPETCSECLLTRLRLSSRRRVANAIVVWFVTQVVSMRSWCGVCDTNLVWPFEHCH